MQLIAITGKRGHGKNTAAEPLEAAGFRAIAFADPLRKIAEIAYGLTMHEMLDPVLKEQPIDRWPFKSPREILQRIGTDMFRKTKFADGEPLDDTWVEVFARACEGYSHVVCTDLRFPNEAKRIRAMGGMIIKIDNPRITLTDGAAQHASETEIDKIVPDWTITNDRDINDLHQAVRMLVGV